MVISFGWCHDSMLSWVFLPSQENMNLILTHRHVSYNYIYHSSSILFLDIYTKLLRRYHKTPPKHTLQNTKHASRNYIFDYVWMSRVFCLLTSHFRCLNHCFLQWRSLVSEPTFVHLFFAIPCLLGWLSISGRLGVLALAESAWGFSRYSLDLPPNPVTVGVHGSDRNFSLEVGLESI